MVGLKVVDEMGTLLAPRALEYIARRDAEVVSQ